MNGSWMGDYPAEGRKKCQDQTRPGDLQSLTMTTECVVYVQGREDVRNGDMLIRTIEHFVARPLACTV